MDLPVRGCAGHHPLGASPRHVPRQEPSADGRARDRTSRPRASRRRVAHLRGPRQPGCAKRLHWAPVIAES
ncbi:hypothetical protein ACFPRL_22545 [Pseudoclavibacter helvolus]